MPSLTHLHIYQRHKKRKDIYICIHPDCRHYQNKDMLLGKRALCVACRNELILDAYHLSHAVPKCMNCSNRKEHRELKRVKESISSLFEESLR